MSHAHAPSPSAAGLAPEARRALAEMERAVADYLGMDLLPDGSVRVHGEDAPRRTVDMLEPFGPIAHRIQWVRDDPQRVVELHRAWSRALAGLGRRARSFPGQVRAFQAALDAVPPPPPPRLRRVA